MVIQLARQLEVKPEALAPLPGFALRCYRDLGDAELWLSLRESAFQEGLPVRPWSRTEFEREFLNQPWWRPERMWFAEATGQAAKASSVVGSIALAIRAGRNGEVAAVHWLMVAHEARRQGVGRLLLAALESAAWGAGYREVRAETHSSWQAALRFYAAMGYERLG